MADLLPERSVHELAAFYQHSVPGRENGASPQRRDSPGDYLRGGPAQSLPLHRRGRTQVQNAPLFRVRSGEPALHHDLKEGRSIVANYVKAGFDTYLIDWGTPTRAERFLTTDDYVNGYLLNVVEHLRKRHGSDQVNILGYCMGGTLSTMFTAIHQDLVKNLVLLATGIDFSTREGLINLWTDPRYFDVDRFVDTMGNIPAEFLQTAFLMLKPFANLGEKPINLMENIHRDEFLDDYLHMETWLNDNIPVPGEVYREFANYLFQQNLLTKNRMPLGRHIVDLRKITCPLLNLMARNDDLVPCAQTEPLNDLVSSTDKEKIIWPAGHIGLAVSGRAQKELWPRAVDWLVQRTD